MAYGRGACPSTLSKAAPRPLAPAITPHTKKRCAGPAAIGGCSVAPSKRASSAGERSAGTAGATTATGGRCGATQGRRPAHTAQLQNAAQTSVSSQSKAVVSRRSSGPVADAAAGSPDRDRLDHQEETDTPEGLESVNAIPFASWTRHRPQGKLSRGFTMLELLLVLAITALASAAVSLAFRDSASTELEQDAVRLAALLDGARAASQRSGVVLRWSPVPNGFRWEGTAGLGNSRWPEGWASPDLFAQVEGGSALVLGPEPVIAAQRVWLGSSRAPALRLAVATDGVRGFEVQRAAPAPESP